METHQAKLAYAVLLPDEFSESPQIDKTSLNVRIGIVAIDLALDPKPSGVQKGRCLSNPRFDEDPFSHLYFDAYVSWGSGRVECDFWRLAYRDLWMVELSAAERMCKLLKRVRAVYEKLPARPLTFGQYVTLMGPALGITFAVQLQKYDGTTSSGNYADNWYVFRQMREAQSHIEHLVQKVGQKHLPAPVSSQ
jgi:hypothetical protein